MIDTEKELVKGKMFFFNEVKFVLMLEHMNRFNLTLLKKYFLPFAVITQIGSGTLIQTVVLIIWRMKIMGFIMFEQYSEAFND